MLFEFRLFFIHFLKFGVQFIFSVAIFVVHSVRIVLLLHFGCSSICLFGKDLIVLTSDLCRWLFIFSIRFSSFVFFSVCRTTVNCCLFRFHPYSRWIVLFSVNLSVLNCKLSYLSIIYQINAFEGIETGFSALFSDGDNVHAQNPVSHEQALLLGCVRNSTFDIILLFGCS